MLMGEVQIYGVRNNASPSRNSDYRGDDPNKNQWRQSVGQSECLSVRGDLKKASQMIAFSFRGDRTDRFTH